MGIEREGYVVRRIERGRPLLLVFGTSSPTDDASGCEDIWDSIAGSRGRPRGLILLRETRGAAYYRGVAGLGDTPEETATSLCLMIDGFQPSEVIACGAGLGGHAALVFGALLDATRVVAVEPVAHLIAEELARYNDRRWRDVLEELPESSQTRGLDALDAMRRAGFSGDAFVLFGTGRGNGAAQAAHHNLVHAQWLARSDRVTLCPFPAVRQGLWGELRRRGQLEAVLEQYLFDEEAIRRDRRRPRGFAGVRTPRPCVVSLFREAGKPGSPDAEVAYAAAGDGEAPVLRKVDDEMRRWIAENLLLGQSPQNVADRMKIIGIPESLALEEIRRASESPYLRGALRLKHRLSKRDWLLSAYSKLGRLHSGSAGIDRRRSPSRGEFYDAYYTLNRPVIIEGMIDHWPARVRWDLDELERRLGDRPVKIRLRINDRDYFATSKPYPTRLMTLAEAIELIRQTREHGDFCLTTEEADNEPALADLRDDIESLPEYLEERSGPSGTIRLAPAGALGSFRHEFRNMLLALVMGKIRIGMVPSWDLPSMRNTWRNRSERDGREMLATPTDPPNVRECTLEAGELLFVPVGWWYFTEAIEPTATVTLTHFRIDNEFPVPDDALGLM